MEGKVSAAPVGSAVRLAIVQPILAPYARPVFEHLVAIPGIDLKIFVLRNTLQHRRGWAVEDEEAFAVEVVGARILKAVGTTPGNRDIKGVRLVSHRIASRVAAWKPDIVMCTDLTAFLSLLPLKVLHPCPVGMLCSDTEVTASQHPLWKRCLRAVGYRWANVHVPYGDASMQYLRGIGVPNDRLIHGMHAVDNTLYDRPSQHTVDRPRTPLRWISVGQLVPRKGFKELINAWAAQGPDFLNNNELWIVGEGPARSDLEHELRRRSLSNTVTLLGHRTPEQLADLYVQSDAFVIPTLMDHWGLVVNEAMATGLPILCSKYSGCHFDLVRDENGVVFDPLDPDAFAAALAAFWRMRDRWIDMGEASHRIVSAYSPAATAEAIANAARSVVA